jgi:hypothetical protein
MIVMIVMLPQEAAITTIQQFNNPLPSHSEIFNQLTNRAAFGDLPGFLKSLID